MFAKDLRFAVSCQFSWGRGWWLQTSATSLSFFFRKEQKTLESHPISQACHIFQSSDCPICFLFLSAKSFRLNFRKLFSHGFFLSALSFRLNFRKLSTRNYAGTTDHKEHENCNGLGWFDDWDDQGPSTLVHRHWSIDTGAFHSHGASPK